MEKHNKESYKTVPVVGGEGVQSPWPFVVELRLHSVVMEETERGLTQPRQATTSGGQSPQLMLQRFIATKQQGLKIREEERERTFISKHMSDFISSAGIQCSIPSANAGTVHTISKSCLS